MQMKNGYYEICLQLSCTPFTRTVTKARNWKMLKKCN